MTTKITKTKKCHIHRKRDATFMTRLDKDDPTKFLCTQCANRAFLDDEIIVAYDNTTGKEREI